MNKPVLIAFFLLSGTLLSAQLLPDRYREEVFSSFVETEEILFSTGVPVPVPGGGFYEWLTDYPLNVKEYQTQARNLYMDVFEPEGDTLTKRPLVVICFGGGFLAGSKDYWSIRLIAQKLALRGYVTATIDYRLGMNIFDADLSVRAPYRGLQDGRSAVRYFKADAAGANLFRIDTSNIYIGGHSAGAFIALHNAYLNIEAERPISTYAWMQNGHPVPDQLCLDCVGDNQQFTGNAKAVFSLAGALGFTDYIQTENDPRVVMFHSQDDDTVPFTSGQPFSSILWLVVGADLPDVYGSAAIASRADEVALPYRFNSYTNRGHSVHEETGSTLYTDIIPGISDSFYVQFLKPIDHEIIGDTHICDDDLQRSYFTQADEAWYYDWQVSGGTLLDPDIYAAEVTVLWDENAADPKLWVTPYSIHGARGNTDSLLITIHVAGLNSWLGPDGDWNNPDLWSLGHPPSVCEDILFPDQDQWIQVTVGPETDALIRSLELGKRVQLEHQPGGDITLMASGALKLRGNYQLYGNLFLKYPKDGFPESLQISGLLQLHGQGTLSFDPGF